MARGGTVRETSVLCLRCHRRATLKPRRDFFGMPAYRCPTCRRAFSYPPSRVTVWVAGGYLVGALPLVAIFSGYPPAYARGCPPYELTFWGWLYLALGAAATVGAVGCLLLGAHARRRVADAEFYESLRKGPGGPRPV